MYLNLYALRCHACNRFEVQFSQHFWRSETARSSVVKQKDSTTISWLDVPVCPSRHCFLPKSEQCWDQSKGRACHGPTKNSFFVPRHRMSKRHLDTFRKLDIGSNNTQLNSSLIPRQLMLRRIHLYSEKTTYQPSGQTTHDQVLRNLILPSVFVS